MEEKARAMNMFLNEDISIIKVSKLLKMLCKNIKRWFTEGNFRNNGGGREDQSHNGGRHLPLTHTQFLRAKRSFHQLDQGVHFESFKGP